MSSASPEKFTSQMYVNGSIPSQMLPLFNWGSGADYAKFTRGQITTENLTQLPQQASLCSLFGPPPIFRHFYIKTKVNTSLFLNH